MAIDPEEHRRTEGRAPETASRVSAPLRAHSVAIPFAVRPASDTARLAPGARKRAAAQDLWARWASWIVSIGAVIFSLIATGGYLYHRGQLAEIAAEHLRLMVTGPARLATDIVQHYTVRTTTVTGEALPAQIEFAVYGPGDELLTAHKETADERGEVHVALRPESRWPAKVRLVTVATYSSRTERAETELAVVSPGHRTALSVFPPVCRGGETLYYRSLSLACDSLSVDRELPIRFEIRDPQGSLLPDSVHEGLTDHGTGWGQFTLPSQATEGVYWLCATSLDDSFPAVRQPFQVRADHVAKPKPTEPPARAIRVRVRPEGGELVAGIENRVYFAAWHEDGGPAHVVGRIVDRRDQTVATVESTLEGMGSVQFQPQAGEQYYLRLDHETKSQEKHLLPPVSGNHAAVLTTGVGVIEPHAPLEFNVRASTAGLPLVAAAFCRGVHVGQQTLVTSVGANPVSIPLPEGVGGTIHLKLYLYRSHPPKLLAERLVFRRPARHLKVQAAVKEAVLRPNGTLDLPISVADEQGRPIAARLSVALCPLPVSAGALAKPNGERQKNEPQSSSVAAEQGKLGSSGSPDAGCWPMAPALLMLEDLDIFPADGVPGDLSVWRRLENILQMLSSPTEADVSQVLDLWLGALGPRPSRVGQTMTSSTQVASQGRLDYPPPMMFDNLQHLLERYQANLIAYRLNRTRILNTLTTISFFGGIGLLIFVAMLSLLNIPCGLRLWGPSLGVAAACILIGAVLSNPERLKRNPGGDVAFTACEAWKSPSLEIAPPPTKAPRSGDTLRPFSSRLVAGKGPPPKTDPDGGTNVILWEPLIQTDASGRASVRIKLPATDGGFQILLDAYADGGRLGSLCLPLPQKAEPAPKPARTAASP